MKKLSLSIGLFDLNRGYITENSFKEALMDQSIDRILLVCNIDGTHITEVNSVIERERKMGYLCVSQSIVPVPNTIPVQYTFSLGFSRSESCGNVGG